MVEPVEGRDPSPSRPVILHVIKGLGIGGAEMLLARAAALWDRVSFDYRVVYVMEEYDQLVTALDDQQIPVHCLRGGRGVGLASIIGLRRLIASWGSALVHAHLPVAGVLARLASPVPVVYTEHNVAGSYVMPTRLANRSTFGRNASVIAVSAAVARSLSGYPGPGPVVIPNGVTCEVGSAEAKGARRELGVGESDPLVVHVGNIRPGKGHEDLIEATALLTQRRPAVTVVSIGAEKTPGDLARLRSAASKAGAAEAIRFLGERRDALAFVAAADVFVNPSRVEGLPLVVLEAMLLGRPVVATAAGGVPEVVRDGKTGLLAEPGDVQAIADGIDRLLGDERLASRLAAAGRDLVETSYGLEAMVRSTERIYRELLAEDPRERHR